MKLRYFIYIGLLLLFGLVIFLPPDGDSKHILWLQFIGHFHPLAVHMPIALILLLGIMEIAVLNQRWSSIRNSIDFILGLTMITALIAPLLGWCLAWSEGFAGQLIIKHMWAGSFIPLLCCLCWSFKKSGIRKLYITCLILSCLLVSWTGYLGGELAHGKGHLSKYTPDPFRTWFGIGIDKTNNKLDPTTLYGARISPIFANKCTSCHGVDKQKGKLRLDMYDLIIKGGKSGAAVVANDISNSELYKRITLPADHDDFMPAENKPALNQDEIKLIELWITNGASETTKLIEVAGASEITAAKPVAEEIHIEDIDYHKVDLERSKLSASVTSLQQRYPYLLSYESRGSANLILNASLMENAFKDSDLAAFIPVAKSIVKIDLSRTAISDESSSTLANMINLQLVRLNHTNIGDQLVAKLTKLKQLNSLSLYSTSISSNTVSSLLKMPNLQRVYIGETKIASSDTSTFNLYKSNQIQIIF